MIPRIPKKLCQQSISLIVESTEKDRFGKPKEVESYLACDNVLVQEQTLYSGSNNSREITANAVIFIFDKISTPMPNLDRNDIGKKVQYDDKEWTITNLVVNKYPTQDKVYSYELEVL